MQPKPAPELKEKEPGEAIDGGSGDDSDTWKDVERVTTANKTVDLLSVIAMENVCADLTVGGEQQAVSHDPHGNAHELLREDLEVFHIWPLHR